MNIAKKALVFTSAVAIAAGTSVPGTSVSAKTRLSGAGASFPAKIYTRWFSDLANQVDQELIIKLLVLALEEKHLLIKLLTSVHQMIL